MLTINVDGEEHGRYNDLEGTFITVGSSASADVRLSWAAPTSLTIHFLHSWGNFVVVNDEEGMTHSGAHRVYDNGWMIFVGMGKPMTIRGHVITFTPDIGDLEQRLGMCDMHA
jgi:hypothetical protein